MIVACRPAGAAIHIPAIEGQTYTPRAGARASSDQYGCTSTTGGRGVGHGIEYRVSRLSVGGTSPCDTTCTGTGQIAGASGGGVPVRGMRAILEARRAWVLRAMCTGRIGPFGRPRAGDNQIPGARCGLNRFASRQQRPAGGAKHYDTGDSQIIPESSTNPAQCCLASGI